MKEYSIDDLFYTKWDLVPARSILNLVELFERLERCDEGSMDYGVALIAIMRLLRKNTWLVNRLDARQVVDCFNDLQFLRRSAGRFSSPWHHWPIGSFVKNGQRFTKPENSELPISTLSFAQLCYADAAFSAYCVIAHDLTTEGSPQKREELVRDSDRAVSSLLAILYTPASHFNVLTIESKALVAQKLPAWQKLTVAHTYANIRDFITDRCPNLFPKSQEPASSVGEKLPPTFTGKMWQDLRYDLAESPVFQGLKTASEAKIYDALDFLEKKQIEAIEQQRRGQNDKA